MTHPYTLHATANLWSLHRSWPQLLQAQRAASAAAADDGDRGTLQAWRPGSGVHGGPGGGLDAALDRRSSAVESYFDGLAERVRVHVWQARWLAVSHLRRDLEPIDGTYALAAAIPQVDPATARDMAAELAAADGAIRRTLRIPPQQWALPGAPACPCCGIRMLRAQTAAPDSATWTVVCTGGCRCLGDDCPCGMPIRVRGVGHIWSQAALRCQFCPVRRAAGERKRVATASERAA